MNPQISSHFRESMLAAGITPPEDVFADGEIHRFPTNDKTGDRSGWYVLYDDGLPAGRFGCWRTNIDEAWRADINRKLTAAEERESQETARRLKEARAKEKAERQEQAKNKAQQIINDGSVCSEHPYLSKKKVKPHGAKLHEGNLVIPVYSDGEIVSLQMIDEDGDKRFLPGGKMHGGYYPMGRIKGGDTLCVVEGFATGASINEATGFPVAVAFNTSGLLPVAEAMNKKYPHCRILLCADDDYRTDGNPGVTKAKEAAIAVGGEVIIPDFSAERPEKATDFNDLAVLRGMDVVKEQLFNPVFQNIDNDMMVDWEDPVPINAELTPVETMTARMIPGPFVSWISDAASRMQIPIDYLVVPAIVGCGSLIGTSCRIRPKQNDDWTVTPNTWGAIIGPPSALKSPALSETVNKPFARLEIEAREQYESAAAQHDADTLIIGAKKDAIQAEIKRAVKTERSGNDVESTIGKLSAELAELQQTVPPIVRRFITNDSSIEKLVELLNENPRGLLYFRDELIGLFKRTEKAGNEQDRAFFLESFNGDGSHTDDRIGRGTVRTDSLCISLLGGIQPDKIIGYLNGALNNGDNDGFVQRLQLMIYPDPVDNWEYKDQKPDVDAKEKAFSILETLSTMDAGGEDGFLRFTDEGQEVFKTWLTWLETEKLVNGDEHPVMLQHLAKYRSLMPSLSLIFHLIDMAAGDTIERRVSAQAARMAAAWCQYLESHARRIYNLALNNDQIAAARLAEKIQGGKLGTEFKRHQVVSKKWGMLSKRDHAQSAIDCLMDNGWLRESHKSVGAENSGRPPAVTYQVNPKIFS